MPQTCLRQQEGFSRTAGGRDINLFLTSPPGSADNVPGAAQSPELLRVGCSGLGRPGEKLGFRKFLDSYIVPSRYYQSLPSGPAPDPHSGSGTGDLEDRRGFERREIGRDLCLLLTPCHKAPVTKVWVMMQSIQRVISLSMLFPNVEHHCLYMTPSLEPSELLNMVRTS